MCQFPMMGAPNWHVAASGSGSALPDIQHLQICHSTQMWILAPLRVRHGTHALM